MAAEARLRGAMVGMGTWGERQLLAWQSVPNAEIVAICDQDPQRLASARDRFGIAAAFRTIGDLLESTDIDFVDICTRPQTHLELVRQVASRGLPVLCQKPFCTSYEEACTAVEHCEGAGVRLMINENFRWQSWYRKAEELLRMGAIGQPFAARIHWRRRMSLPEFNHPQDYFRDMPRLAVYELGVHYIDVFRMLFGEPKTVYARLQRVSPHVRGEDVQLIVLTYPNGLTCTIDHSWASVAVPGIDRPEGRFDNWEVAHPMEIDGTQGTLALWHDRTLYVCTDDDRQSWMFPVETRFESQVKTQAHFVDCLRDNQPFETSGRMTLKTLRIVYACYESSLGNTVVALNSD
jgi:predicted dehydrogenase